EHRGVTLEQSVLSPSVAQATFAATLFDEWIRGGLRDVVICPGSRSTPLALAASARRELTIHVRIDERSAGFFAIGRSLITKRPVAIVVTSGTAAAELHACVAEASQAFVPLLVVTADRPPQLRGVGAPQTIDQRKLFGHMVRRFEDPGVPTAESVDSWRPLANQLMQSARNPRGDAGPVHLNVAFVEPLVGIPVATPEPLITEHESWVRGNGVANLDELRVLCVVGLGVSSSTIEECQARHWVVIGDATANGSTPYFDALLRVPNFVASVAPDVVVRMGGLPASKVLQERLRQWCVRTIGFDGAGFVADPDRLVGELLTGLPDALSEPKANGDYFQLWSEASHRVGEWLASLDEETTSLNEALVARCVVAASTEHAVPLVVGSSMPVRDVEWWAETRTMPTFSNRGVNGIDGVISTVLGVAAGESALGLVGDITMLHDVSGLVDGLGVVGGSCVLVVVDNNGGGIFSFLSQASVLDDERFEQLFGTPRHHDLGAIARAFGHAGVEVSSIRELRQAIDKGLATDGVSVIVVKVPSRAANVAQHDVWNEHVAQLFEHAQ
ncbi:MAG: 2-succinyl-5-enolpyruvyl-6-hydroxy-3-cyclohexene-1-carboxylic-acid synthase, partial [Acidimicrobiales bacterium]